MSESMDQRTTPLALGVVGAGSIVRNVHLPGFAKIPGVDVVAVANRHADSAQAVAREFGIGTVYEHWEDVVDDDQVHAVVIGTPPYMHPEVTLRALDRGKHVFCQARMANDLEPALQMLAADQQTDLTTMLCPAPHYMSVAEHVRGLLGDERSIGQVRHVVVEHAGSMFIDPQAPLHWRQRNDLNGINALDVGIVAEVLLRWFGAISEVSAVERTWVPERLADPVGRTTVQNPDSISVVGTFASGATLTALFSGAIRNGEPHMIVHGDQGSLICSPQSASIHLRRGDEHAKYDVPEAERGIWRVEQDFVDAVRHGEKGTPSFDDGARCMAVTRAITDAARLGTRVTVHDL